MPKSKNRRKNGKKVKHSAAKREQRLEDAPTGVTFQDLINVLAYQEYVKDGTIIADDAEINIPEQLPVMIGEGEDRRQVGVATPIPGDEGSVSVRIDPEHQHLISGDVAYSIGDSPINKEIDFSDPDVVAVVNAVSKQKENEDGR